MSVNTGLDLKTSFLEKEKEVYNKSEISILMQCYLKCGVAFFIASHNFQVLMKELALILIHVHKSSTVGCPSKLCYQCAS